MGFFDLNIPYHESDRNATDKPSLRGRRLKLALKAMELGFTGVAYNRTLKGVMSESDRCSTTLFPISKLTPSSSSFFASVKFHREILNVSVSAPFRQYTRLTVIVDSPSQASALNAGNPVLRSYDIVAVRPMNQNAFDQACQTSEVDMISIDFSEKLQLPFRLKQPMIKAAIKRGVYFEITYSGLLLDPQSRRQTISNCKLLVDWTRGKNLILCSAATSATELRGPQDVANLFSLLRLPRDRAKAAISSNCRSLLANALRKKHFYKEAVKVEGTPSGGQVNPAKSLFDDWLNWDPISSGQGDLLLDEMEKFSATSKTAKQNVKTVNFTSKLNGLPAHGLHIKDLIYATKTTVEPHNADKLAVQVMVTDADDASDEKLKKQSGLNNLDENADSPRKLSNDDGGVKIGFQISDLEGSTLLSLPTSNCESRNFEEIIPAPNEKLDQSNDLEVNKNDSEPNLVTSEAQVQDAPLVNQVPLELSNAFSESSSSAFQFEADVEKRDMGVRQHEGIEEKILIENGNQNMHERCLASNNVDGGQYSKMTDSSVELGDGLSPERSSKNSSTSFDNPMDDGMRQLNQIDSVDNNRGLAKSQAVMSRRKRKSSHSHQPFLFPFKHVLKPKPSMKKSRK